jgi:uncharacterized protein (TIGR00369 family)
MSDFEPKNPEYEMRARDSFNRQKVMHTLGIAIAALEPGRVVLEMAHDAALTQQHGFLHAGIVSTALDSACGYAAFSLMPAEAAVLTVGFKPHADLLRGARLRAERRLRSWSPR